MDEDSNLYYFQSLYFNWEDLSYDLLIEVWNFEEDEKAVKFMSKGTEAENYTFTAIKLRNLFSNHAK